MRKPIFATATLIAASLSSQAFAVTMSSHDANGRPFATRTVEVLSSAEGETKAGFILRASQAMSGHTKTSGFETCASLSASADARFAISIQTSSSRVGCYDPAIAPAGFTLTSERFTSRVNHRTLYATRVDLPFLGRSPETRVIRRDPSRITAADRAAGPLYVVAGDRVQHIDASGSVVDVGPISGA